MNKKFKKKMMQCVSVVNKDHVKRKQINGIEHIIVSSYTLPDNVVMNDILYPAFEIAKSFKTLERTLAPVEHPTNADGEFISASDPEAIHNFHAGAFNVNVTRESGRVHIEKHINVVEAQKTDRGKRLLDRINELETSEKPRPIHTSVGLFLSIENLDKPRTNAKGDQYSMIGRDFEFDHDAILLDSVGAATPAQGVGLAVNASGSKVDVDRISFDKLKTSAEGISDSDVREQLLNELQNTVAADWLEIEDVFDDVVIFETGAGYFQAPYTISDEKITLSGIPIRVDKMVEYQPKINNKKGDEHMKELIINALVKAGISTDGLSDDDLFKAYNKLVAKESTQKQVNNEKKPEPKNDDAFTTAINSLTERVKALDAKMNAKVDDEKANLIKTIVNSKKYPQMTEEEFKVFPLETLKKMAASTVESHGIPFDVNNQNKGNEFSAPTEMPK